MASDGGLLRTYQQQKYVNGLPLSSVGRRTLRLREKYILLLVVSVFAFVCFGAIFFMPDMRDRVAADGHIRPVDIGDMFVPRLPAGGVQNRHGQGNLRDPHDLNDQRIFRDRVQKAPHHLAISQRPRPQTFRLSSSGRANAVVSSGLRAARQWNGTMKVLPNSTHMDSVARERQEKVKQVQTLHLKSSNFSLTELLVNHMSAFSM